MDLNKVLPTLLETATLEQMAELVSFNLKPETIVAEMKRAERFDLVPAFLPLLNLEERDDLCFSFADIYAQLLVRDEKEKAEPLFKNLEPYLTNERIAFCYGKLTKEDKLPDWADQSILDKPEYLRGIAYSNNLKLFIHVYDKFNVDDHERRLILKEAIPYRSGAILEYIRPQKEDLYRFLLYNEDPEIVDFLLSVAEPAVVLSALKKSILNQLKLSRYREQSQFAYIRTCLQRQWITFTEKEWEAIKDSDYYEVFASDV